MTTSIQRDKATRFRALHGGGRILVLPNAWDAASARIFELAGFPAIGTTSAGVAASRARRSPRSCAGRRSTSPPGRGPMQATLGLARRIAEELRTRGAYDGFSAGALAVGEVNAMMAAAVDRTPPS